MNAGLIARQKKRSSRAGLVFSLRLGEILKGIFRSPIYNRYNLYQLVGKKLSLYVCPVNTTVGDESVWRGREQSTWEAAK